MKHTPPAPTRATLTVRGVVPRAVQPPKAPPAKPAAPAVPAGTLPPPPPDDVPNDAPLSWCNWYVGRRRPSRRYLTREQALAEARRLRAENPGARVLTFELRLVTEDAP